MKPVAIDLETFLIQPGVLAPVPVCGSSADEGGQSVFGIDTTQATYGLPHTVRESELIIGAHIAYDFGVSAAHGLVSLEDIFKAYDEDRVYDVLIAQALDAIATGHLFKDPRTGGVLRDPTNGKLSQRYSLAICTDLTLGRVDAKKNDEYRLRYGLLAGLPMAEWPEEALQYPKDDARNTFDVAMAQLGETTRPEGAIWPGKEPLQNLHDLPAQARAAWALHLASMWGFRTDRARVEALAARVDGDHEKALAAFKPLGFIREDGSEDTAVVKKAVALAYGASGTCARCGGTGKVLSTSGTSTKRLINCKGGTAPDGSSFGCDGTGFDLGTAPSLVRTPAGGVSASRDTLTESGDDTLMAYGMVSESEKVRGTYLPFLQSGLDFPINPRPNVLVESGRTSYSDPTQTFPRSGGLRECIVPRPGSVFCSIDYSAIELCTLAQACVTLLGKSRMAEVINETGDPGSLHTSLAASMLGISFEELRARVKAKDSVAIGYRQAAKPAGFGFPGGMGASTLVLANRKGVAGVTPCENATGFVKIMEDGKERLVHGYQGVRFCVHLGADRCGAAKVTEWKGKVIPPTCKACIESAEDLRAQWFKQWPEMKEYFAIVSRQVENTGRIEQLFSGRVRDVSTGPGNGFTSAANGYFQGLAADGAKAALYAVSKECYLDRESPMYGARPIFFNHDEIFSEIPLAIASNAAKRMTKVMIDTMRTVVPDVTVAAEPCLMWRWSKDAQTLYDVDGELIPDPRTL